MLKKIHHLKKPRESWGGKIRNYPGCSRKCYWFREFFTFPRPGYPKWGRCFYDFLFLGGKANKIQMSRRFIIFILILLTFFTYANTLKNNFVWDDVFFIVNNNYIKNLSFLPQYFYSVKTYANIPDYYIFRPLRTVTFAFDYKFWGLNPFGFHLNNVILHILNVLIVYFLISKLTSNQNLGFITALIFSLHPIQTEAVAWVKGRADLLFTLFFLLGFLTFLKREEKENYSQWDSILIYFLFSLSLLSKIMAITFPFVLILYKISLGRERNRALDKFFFFSLFFIILAFLFSRHLVIGRTTQSAYLGGGAYYTFLTMLKVFPSYLKTIIYPLNLIADYSGMKVSRSIFEPEIRLSLLFYLVIFFVLFLSWKKNRLIFFALSFFFLTLAPVSNIVPTMQFMAERFLYLPALGIFLILAFLILKGASFISSRQTTLWLLVTFLSVNLITLTINRNSVWRDELTLWQETINSAPRSYRIMENLTFTYINRGLPDKAIPLLEKLLPMSKKKYKIYDFLGIAYYRKKEMEKARYYFEEAIKLKPDLGVAYGHLGLLSGEEKKYNLSKEYLEKAIELDPDSSETTYYYNNLGLTFKNLGEEKQAKEMFEMALLKNPDNIEALKNLGAIFWKEKNWEMAVSIYQRLNRLLPENREFKYWLKRAKSNL